ncbi:MAG: RNA polymerase sigma factor [Phycisphaerales bacterium]|nr:MAG: RNA polymerase sigma factor [Phycisphaerales bacterium]
MNQEAFQKTLAELGDRTYSYAVWLLGDREEAQDVTQEGFMRLWARRSAVVDGAAWIWLTRTIYRLCVDHQRRRAVRRENELLESSQASPSPEPGPEQLAELTELQSAIGSALGRLSPRDRVLIVLREIQGMSCEEMADVLQMKLNTLKSAVHRARDRLRKELVKMGVQRQ